MNTPKQLKKKIKCGGGGGGRKRGRANHICIQFLNFSVVTASWFQCNTEELLYFFSHLFIYFPCRRAPFSLYKYIYFSAKSPGPFGCWIICFIMSIYYSISRTAFPKSQLLLQCMCNTLRMLLSSGISQRANVLNTSVSGDTEKKSPIDNAMEATIQDILLLKIT